MDIGRQVPHLDMHGELRLMDVHRRIGIGLAELAAHVLAKLYAGHGEGLVAALGLNLEAPCPLHILPEIVYGQSRDGVLVLCAACGPGQIDYAENLFQRVKGGIHVLAVAPRLHIHRGLETVDPKAANGRQTAADVAHKLQLEAFAVQSLQHQLPKMEQNDIVHLHFSFIRSLCKSIVSRLLCDCNYLGKF